MKLMDEFIDMALGKTKAELVLKHCRIVDVFNGEIEENDIAIHKGRIVGMGQYTGDREIDVEHRFVCPGFIDAHVHLESSMVTPSQFARAVLPCGTTAVIADPHEIANVHGIKGIEYLLNCGEALPLDIFMMLPSCVPATEFETSGARLLAEDLKKLAKHPHVLGLGEMMNYPGVLNHFPEVMDKIELFKDRVIDGHAPGLSGKPLNAYRLAGVATDHECTTVEEMREKLSRGMYIHIREGSAAKNLKTLIRGVNRHNLNRITFCTDDKHPEDILNDGHINYNIRLAVQNGMDVFEAIRAATLNTAECYGLKDRGAVAPGKIADLVVLDNLMDVKVFSVFKNGKQVVENGKPVMDIHSGKSGTLGNSIYIPEADDMDFSLGIDTEEAHVISIKENSILTGHSIRKVKTHNGLFEYDREKGIIKLAVVERHHKTGHVGLGLVENYGLQKGAIATTIAHDSHNIIVAGTNDADMKLAVSELGRMSGGIVICEGSKVISCLRLEVGGLMTHEPLEKVSAQLKAMQKIARGLGVNPGIDPFMTLSFLALPVIPELKLTDKGLFDAINFRFIDIQSNRQND